MAEIKRNTEVMSLNHRLKEFEPRGTPSLHDAVAQVKSNLKSVDGNSNEPLAFVPSSQLLECRRVPNSVVTKNKTYPTRMSSLNRDSLSQKSVESYFKKVESGSEIDSEKSTEESTSTDYKESDSTSNFSSHESSIRNVPLMEGGSDSAQEYCCEEYDEEILNSDNEIEISQQGHDEPMGEVVDNKTRVLSEITVRHDEHLNKTAVKTEVVVNIKQEQGSNECFDRQDMTPDLSKVKMENSFMTLGEGSYLSLVSQFHNCRVKEENPVNPHMLPVDMTNCRIETVTQNSNIQTARKRKSSQILFGDSSDDETYLESGPDDQCCCDSNKLSQNNDTVSLKLGRHKTHNEIQANKMDKSSFPLRNTSNKRNIKKRRKMQEVTVSPMDKNSRCNVQNISENFKDTQRDVSSSGNCITKVIRQTVADTVVKHLMPFYKEKRIASRELFKLLARELAHHLLEHCSTGKLIWNHV